MVLGCGEHLDKWLAIPHSANAVVTMVKGEVGTWKADGEGLGLARSCGTLRCSNIHFLVFFEVLGIQLH